MTRVRDASAPSTAQTIPAAWAVIAEQPPLPSDSAGRFRWLRVHGGVSDRALVTVALAVLQDRSDMAVMLHTRATGVLYRTAKMVIEAGAHRLGRYGRKVLPTRDEVMAAVDDVVGEAIAKTTARSGGEWVTYLAVRINGEVNNHLLRGTARQDRLVGLGEDEFHADLGEAPASPSVEVVEQIVLHAIEAVTTTDDQRRALEAMFAVGRYTGLPGSGSHTQAEAAELSGLSQQRVSVLRRRMKAYLYEQLGVAQDDDED